MMVTAVVDKRIFINVYVVVVSTSLVVSNYTGILFSLNVHLIKRKDY